MILFIFCAIALETIGDVGLFLTYDIITAYFSCYKRFYLDIKTAAIDVYWLNKYLPSRHEYPASRGNACYCDNGTRCGEIHQTIAVRFGAANVRHAFGIQI